jgi:DNA anti-recombination protein RmuC
VSDKVSTSVSLTAENREYIDREVNNRSAFINDLIQAHRQGKSDMEETIARHRRQQLQSELRKIKSREQSVKDELEHLNQKITEEKKRKQKVIQDAKEALDGTRLTTDNPAVRNWAEDAGITPEELIEEIQ